MQAAQPTQPPLAQAQPDAATPAGGGPAPKLAPWSGRGADPFLQVRLLDEQFDQLLQSVGDQLAQPPALASLEPYPHQAWGAPSQPLAAGQPPQSLPTPEACAAACSAQPSCTGATYDTAQQTCDLRAGAGVLVPAGASSIALVAGDVRQAGELRRSFQQLLALGRQLDAAYEALPPGRQVAERVQLAERRRRLQQQLQHLRAQSTALRREAESAPLSAEQAELATHQQYLLLKAHLVILLALVLILVRAVHPTSVWPAVGPLAVLLAAAAATLWALDLGTTAGVLAAGCLFLVTLAAGSLL